MWSMNFNTDVKYLDSSQGESNEDSTLTSQFPKTTAQILPVKMVMLHLNWHQLKWNHLGLNQQSLYSLSVQSCSAWVYSLN